MSKRQDRRINKTRDAALEVHRMNRERLAASLFKDIDLESAPAELVELSKRLAELWDWLSFNDPYLTAEHRKVIVARLEKIRDGIADATATALRKV